SGCVRATVIDAFCFNFRVAVIEECTFDRGEASHAINLFDMHQKYADVVPAARVIDYFAGVDAWRSSEPQAAPARGPKTAPIDSAAARTAPADGKGVHWMALLLDSNDIEPLLTPKLCIDALDDAFRDYGAGKAATAIGREVILTRLPNKEIPATGARKGHAYHGLEVQSGTVPRFGVACLRVKSDILYWPKVDGDYRRKKF